MVVNIDIVGSGIACDTVLVENVEDVWAMLYSEKGIIDQQMVFEDCLLDRAAFLSTR